MPSASRGPGRAEAKLLSTARTLLANLNLDDRLPQPLRDAALAATEPDDIAAAMRGIATACLDLQSLSSVADMLLEDCRRTLLHLLQESGAGTLLLPNHTVEVVTPKAKPSVADPKLVPASVTVQGRAIPLWTSPKVPEPKVDLDAVRVEQAAGATVPGIVMANGTPHIRFVSTEKATKPRGKPGRAAA